MTLNKIMVSMRWALSMRNQIKEHVIKDAGKGLEVIVMDAIKEHL